MIEFKCCGNCAKYRPNSNIDSKNGVCEEYEMLVCYYKNSCGWYCKKEYEERGGTNNDR